MHNLAESNLVRFKNISKTKKGIFANFSIKGERGGATFTASISVDLVSADVSASDAMEVIIEKCAQVGLAEFKRCEFQFEGILMV